MIRTPSPPTPSTPTPTSDPAVAMLDLMMRLADLLAHETELVRAGHVSDIAALQREKLRLSMLYQGAIKQLESSGTRIVALPAPLRAQIAAAAGRLAEVVAQNERTLRIGRAATRKLLDMLVESVRSTLRPAIRYNARLKTSRYAPVLAVAIDQRL